MYIFNVELTNLVSEMAREPLYINNNNNNNNNLN